MRAVKSQSRGPAGALEAYVLPRAMKAEKCFPSFLWGIGPLASLSLEARFCPSLHLSLYHLGAGASLPPGGDTGNLAQAPLDGLSVTVGLLWAGRKSSFLPGARLDPFPPLISPCCVQLHSGRGGGQHLRRTLGSPRAFRVAGG